MMKRINSSPQNFTTEHLKRVVKFLVDGFVTQQNGLSVLRALLDFGDRKSVCQNLSWTVGINDWQGLSQKIKEHELTTSHLFACGIYNTWKRNLTVVAQMSSAYAQEVSYWTEVLTRIVNVTLTLASCNTAFRGHREKK